MSKGHIAGFYHAQIAFRTSAGYPMGTDTTPDTVSNGATTHAYKLLGPVTLGAPAVTGSRATYRGGQKYLGNRYLGNSDIGEFAFTLSEMDDAFRAYVTGASVDTTTFTGIQLASMNALVQDPPEFIALFTAGFTDSAGAQKFLNVLYHNVQIANTGIQTSQADGENPNPFEYTAYPNISSRTGLGPLFSATALNVVDNTDIVSSWVTSKPCAITTYIDDGIATTFTLGYLPTSSTTTGGENLITRNGVVFTPTSVNTSTGVVTITAGTAGDVIVVVYPTDFLPIP